MAKKIIAVLMSLSLLFVLCSCASKGDNEEQTSGETNTQINEVKPTEKNVDLKKVYDDCVALMPEMTVLDAEMMYNFCGVNPEDCAESYVAVCADSLRADEIWIIKAKDAESLKRIEEAAKNRLQAKDEESITYSPEQNKIVKAAKTIIIGEYFGLLVSPDVDELANVCYDAAK